MGNSEERKPSNSEKSSSPVVDQTNIHVYPDWAAMQAYYRPRVALPPYYNPAVTSAHPPHPYMWGPPQAMMPPYGAPYAALYSHGAVYAHPAVPIGQHSSGHEVPTTSACEALAVFQHGKNSGNGDQGLMKKLKGFDGLAMSIGNGNSDSANGGADCTRSQSGETEGSSNGYDARAAKTASSGLRRCHEVIRVTGGEVNTDVRGKVPGTDVSGASDMELGVTAFTGATGKVGAAVSTSTTPMSDLRDSTNLNGQNSANIMPQASAILPSEAWLQNERDLKRERRKQSNRESARRSRLRKQAETEELAIRVETLGAENAALKAEINRLTEHSEKLRLQNTHLLEKLRNTQGESSSAVANWRTQVSSGGLFLRADGSGSGDRREDEEYEDPNSGTKLHQLLDTSPRADAVAAG